MSRYPKDGKEFPSVTEIIGDCTDKSKALVPWAANCACDYIKNELLDSEGILSTSIKNTLDVIESARTEFRTVSQKALDIGSLVHSMIEEYYKTNRKLYVVDFDDATPEVKKAWSAFMEWDAEYHPEILATEETVYGRHIQIETKTVRNLKNVLCQRPYGWAGTLDLRCILKGEKTVIDFKTSKAMYMNEYRPQIAAYRSVFPNVTRSAILRIDKITGIPEYKDVSKHYEHDLKTFHKMADLYYHRHPRIAKKARL